MTTYCTLCPWRGDIGGEAHAALIHPDTSTAVVRQIDTAFVVRVLSYHPPDGHNLGRGSWQTDAEGYVTEPLVNEGAK